MAWTTPATAVTGDIIPASFWNTYGRDNLAYLKSLLDGTGGAVTVTVPGPLRIENDANFGPNLFGGNPVFNFDPGDAILYDRAANIWNLYFGGSSKLAVNASGKITGTAFYNSGEISVTNGGTPTVSHGLGARPRFVSVYKATTSGSEDSKTQRVDPVTITNTQIFATPNTDGATRYYNIYAML